MFSNQKKPKKTPEFSCILCDFNTCNKKDYNKHLQTKKHFINNNQCFSMEKTPKTPNLQKQFTCVCGKNYNDNSGLWRHKKKCTFKNNTDIYNDNLIVENNTDINYDNLIVEKLTSLIIDVVKQNQAVVKDMVKQNQETVKDVLKQNQDIIKQNNELTSKITDVCKYQNNTTITNNSNNKTFNLNVFLNETCKDAMNMSEFINSLQIEYDDFEKVGEIGFVNGISNIIIKNLKDLDITQRPLHCTDKKREVLYVKEDNVWQKEDEKYLKIRKLIKKAVNKNTLLIPEFKKRYPDCGTSKSKYSDKYDLLLIETMGGSGDNDYEKETKILKNIAREVVINKVL